MSSIFGAKENPLASTRLLDNPPPDQKPKYRFSMTKWLMDKLFPARALILETARSGDSPKRS